MFAIKKVIIHFIHINIVFPIEGLIELPPVEDNNILVTEAVIRTTINTLFSNLKLKGIKHNPKLKQYSTVHNFFATLTLKDQNNLKEIAKLSRFDNKSMNNGTESFMAIINELLNDDENTEVIDGVNVNNYIVNFLSDLGNLKETYGLNNNLANFNINGEILNILQKDDSSFNETSDTVELTQEGSVLNENEFWQPNGRRVYRGERTKIKYFPFMASIQIFHQFQCGGSIIHSDLIITAASCVQLAWNNRFFRENPAFLSVRVGSTFYNGGGEDISVLEVYFNPEYNPKNLRNNLCLLRLSRRIKFRKKRRKRVRRIDIDRNPSALPMTTDGITIVGWGARDAISIYLTAPTDDASNTPNGGGAFQYLLVNVENRSNIIGNPWSNRLAFTVLDVYPLEDCQEIYSSQYVTRKHFCAGFLSKGGGACNRDVGGPGIVHGILGGVVSFGSPVCGTPDAPTVFTKLGYYSDWIDEIMEQDVPHIKTRTTLKQKFSLGYQPSATTEKLTSFKIAPIHGGKMKPINVEKPLRFVDNDDLFEEFLTTMFGSKEIEDLQDIVDYDENNTTENNDKTMNVIRQPVNENTFNDLKASLDNIAETATESARFATKIYDFDYTVLDPKLSVEDRHSESDIAGIPKDKTVGKSTEESISSDSEDVQLLDIENNDKIQKRWHNIDDSVLTLLYLSDSEKLNEDKNVEINDSEGISIDLNSFQDMTFKSKSDPAEFIDFLPKNELYDLLFEAIEIETKNKN